MEVFAGEGVLCLHSYRKQELSQSFGHIFMFSLCSHCADPLLVPCL